MTSPREEVLAAVSTALEATPAPAPFPMGALRSHVRRVLHQEFPLLPQLQSERLTDLILRSTTTRTLNGVLTLIEAPHLPQHLRLALAVDITLSGAGLSTAFESNPQTPPEFCG